MSEASEQAAVIQWARMLSKRHPALKWLHHPPNGGSRNKIEAVNLKRQGVLAGIPDLSLPYPSGGKHGLYIEMKYGRNKLTAAQKECLAYLSSVGYATAVCYSAQQAIKVITQYIDGEYENQA